MSALFAMPHWKDAPSPLLMPRFNPFAKVFGWVPEPYVNTRGTLGLLQSCILTTFFCVATSLHLNIPKEGQSTIHRTWTRCCWIIANTLAPEIMLTVAMTQYLEARILLRDIDELCERFASPNPHWDMTQAFYYNMRGFLMHVTPGARRESPDDADKPKTLKMKHIDAIVELGWLHLIDVPAERIKEYSKQNRLAKTIALVQALWFVIQTIARVHQHLPTSPFEITTIAYVACTFISWLLWLNKPQDIGFSTEIPDADFRVVRQLTHQRRRKSRSHDSQSFRGWKSQLPNLRSRKYRFRDKVYLGITWSITAAIFGGLHLLAWNYEFPTTEETVMWRCSCIAIMVLPPLFYVWVIIRHVEFDGSNSTDFIGIFITFLYLVARLYNVLEVFFSLRSTPPDLYVTVQWPNWLPHF
jgi:hypothetical protein